MHRRTEVWVCGLCGVCDPGEPGRGQDTALLKGQEPSTIQQRSSRLGPGTSRSRKTAGATWTPRVRGEAQEGPEGLPCRGSGYLP